uniref:Uncharacterized protein n=1 Tax=Anguilla anguilla TaxID=7936 RepID=A0A0E9SSB4_ANGAN
MFSTCLFVPLYKNIGSTHFSDLSILITDGHITETRFLLSCPDSCEKTVRLCASSTDIRQYRLHANSVSSINGCSLAPTIRLYSNPPFASELV